MNTRADHNGIHVDLLMNEEPRLLSDGTWAHPVRIISRASIDDLPKLIGMKLWDETVTSYLPERGVQNQTLQTVGLVLKSKKW